MRVKKRAHRQQRIENTAAVWKLIVKVEETEEIEEEIKEEIKEKSEEEIEEEIQRTN